MFSEFRFSERLDNCDIEIGGALNANLTFNVIQNVYRTVGRPRFHEFALFDVLTSCSGNLTVCVCEIVVQVHTSVVLRLAQFEAVRKELTLCVIIGST